MGGNSDGCGIALLKRLAFAKGNNGSILGTDILGLNWQSLQNCGGGRRVVRSRPLPPGAMFNTGICKF